MNETMEASCQAWTRGVDDGPPKQKRRPGKGGASEVVSWQNLDTPNSPQLQDLADKIKIERDAFERTSMNAANHLIALGGLLDRARQAIGRGGWLAWIETNCSISQRHVYNYMAIASAVHAGKLEVATVANLGVKAAIKLIGKPKTGPATEAAPSDTPAHYVPPAPSPALLPASTEPADIADPHILDQTFGPLSGVEWMDLAEDCWRRAVTRGPRKRPGRHSEAFQKLVAHFNVPLADLEAVE